MLLLVLVSHRVEHYGKYYGHPYNLGVLCCLNTRTHNITHLNQTHYVIDDTILDDGRNGAEHYGNHHEEAYKLVSGV